MTEVKNKENCGRFEGLRATIKGGITSENTPKLIAAMAKCKDQCLAISPDFNEKFGACFNAAAKLNISELVEIFADYSMLNSTNKYTEKLVLLAKHFGSDFDLNRALKIKTAFESGDNPDDSLVREYDSLLEKLLENLKKAFRVQRLRFEEISQQYLIIFNETATDPASLEITGEATGDEDPFSVRRQIILDALKKYYNV